MKRCPRCNGAITAWASKCPFCSAIISEPKPISSKPPTNSKPVSQTQSKPISPSSNTTYTPKIPKPIESVSVSQIASKQPSNRCPRCNGVITPWANKCPFCSATLSTLSLYSSKAESLTGISPSIKSTSSSKSDNTAFNISSLNKNSSQSRILSSTHISKAPTLSNSKENSSNINIPIKNTTTEASTVIPNPPQTQRPSNRCPRCNGVVAPWATKCSFCTAVIPARPNIPYKSFFSSPSNTSGKQTTTKTVSSSSQKTVKQTPSSTINPIQPKSSSTSNTHISTNTVYSKSTTSSSASTSIQAVSPPKISIEARPSSNKTTVSIPPHSNIPLSQNNTILEKPVVPKQEVITKSFSHESFDSYQHKSINKTTASNDALSRLLIAIYFFLGCGMILHSGILDYFFSGNNIEEYIYIVGSALMLCAVVYIFSVICAKFTDCILSIFPPFRKCIHGIRNGTKMLNGSLKCPDCETIRQNRLEREYKEYIQKQQLKEYQNQFTHNLAFAIKKRREILISDDETIHKMSPYEFEGLVANLFRKLGYQAYQTPPSKDGGKDVILFKDGKKYFVECKRYQADKTISRPTMQKLYAAIREENAVGGFFVATCRFTQDALEYGKKNKIQTIDLNQLLDLLSRTNETDSASRHYSLTCRHCGSSVAFDMWDDESKKICPNGHTVHNPFYAITGQTPICLKCGSLMRTARLTSGTYYVCHDMHQSSTPSNTPCTYRIPVSEYLQEIDKYSNKN